eukprot:GDKI01040017.1.p2 GENE.GDKI01040017.1~~GDKI01040017.1.p2  ORF type:complete len:106 (-),score=49.74 GDKI01040017.1:253-570(-)
MAQSGSGGLHMPARNEELREKEQQQLHGAALKVKLHLPDGKMEELQITVSKEVGYVKAWLAQRLGLQYNKLVLTYNGRPLIDPMSFCDHPGVTPPELDVNVEIKA